MKNEARILRANQVLKKLVEATECQRDWIRFYQDTRCNALRFPRMKTGKLIDAMTVVLLRIADVTRTRTMLLADLANYGKSDGELVETERSAKDSMRNFVHALDHFQIQHAIWQESAAVRRETGSNKPVRWISSDGVLESVEKNFELICEAMYDPTSLPSSVVAPGRGQVPTRARGRSLRAKRANDECAAG